MNIVCPDCNKSPASPQEHNPAKVTCEGCQIILYAGEALGLSKIGPAKCWIEKDGSDLIIKREWLQNKYYRLGFFNFIPLVVLSLTAFDLIIPEPTLVYRLSTVILTLILLGANYFIFANQFNITTIRLNKDHLRIKHRPLPWRGQRNIPTPQIKSLDIQEHQARSIKGPVISYNVAAMLNSGRESLLIFDLESKEKAEFIVAELQKRLGDLALIYIEEDSRGKSEPTSR